MTYRKKRHPFYDRKWEAARLSHLAKEPLCRYCKAKGLITIACVVDHITPHRGDRALFWCRDNWQSLCTRCHNSVKQSEERGVSLAEDGSVVVCDPDGYPTDGSW